MNQLPIVLLAKQLKYSLAGQKIKTLNKAIQFSSKLSDDDPKKTKIKLLQQKYNQISKNVSQKFAQARTLPTQKTQSINIDQIRDKNDSIYSFLTDQALCEISGGKGSGKTCLLLHLLQKYIQINKPYHQTNPFYIKIFNCTSGITQNRLQKTQQLIKQINQLNFEFIDISNLDEIDKCLSKFIEQYDKMTKKPKVCILIDGITSHLLPKQNSKILIINLFKQFQKITHIGKGCIVLFTNYIQAKYQLGHQDVYNHGTYFCQLNSSYITHKYYTERIQQKENKKWRQQNPNLTQSIENKFSNRIVSIKGQLVTTYLISIQKTGINKIVLESYRELKDLYQSLKTNQSGQNQLEDDNQDHDNRHYNEDNYSQSMGNNSNNFRKKIVSDRIIVTKKIQEQLDEGIDDEFMEINQAKVQKVVKSNQQQLYHNNQEQRDQF